MPPIKSDGPEGQYDPQALYAYYCALFGGERDRIRNTTIVLRRHWKKDTLVSYCRRLGLRVSGTKAEVAERLATAGVFEGPKERRLFYVNDSGEASRLSEALEDVRSDDPRTAREGTRNVE